MLVLVLNLCLSYLVGSIPTGYWVAHYVFHIDITQHGSGNIGATNVARVLKSKKYFLLIFFLDCSKAYFALWGCQMLATYLDAPFSTFHLSVLSSALLIGNAYSIFLRFKGGKGVSTSVGILLYILPLFAGIFFAFAMPIYLCVKRVDVAALIAMTSTTVFYLLPLHSYRVSFAPLLIFMVFWLIYRHRDNFERIRQGVE